MTTVAYALNGIPLCLACVERFDLTSPNEIDATDLLEELTQEQLDNQPTRLRCGSPVCQKELP